MKGRTSVLPFSFQAPKVLPAIARWICCIALALSSFAVTAQGLPVVTLRAGMHLIQAEVANTFDTRGRGLMFRESLGPNRGMLFVFDGASIHCMWMRNTLIPLSVAFIEQDGAIVNIEDMHPRTENTHCARREVRHALEMGKGWFAARGIKPGMKLLGLESAPGPR